MRLRQGSSRHPGSGRTSSAALVALAASAALALVACSQTVGGHGQADKDLSVGLPQKVAPVPKTTGGTVSTPSFGESVTIIESRRLAIAVPRPDVVEPAFTKTCLPTLPLKSVDALGGFGGLFVDGSVNVFRRNGFVAGYVQCRSDPKTGRGTVAAAIEMRDDASAQQTAAELVPTLAGDGDKVVPLNGMNGARAVTSKNKSNDRHIMQTVIPYNRLVLYQYSDDKDSARLGQTVVKTMQAALTRAQQYVPTPLEAMNGLQDDPRGLRKLLVDPGTTYVTGGGYSLDAYYGQAEDPDAERALLQKAGFRAMYQNQGETEAYTIYELGSPAQSVDVLNGFKAIEQRAHPERKEIKVPAAGASSFCLAFKVEKFPAQRCFFTAGKYLYQVDVFAFAMSELNNPKYANGVVTKQKAIAPKG